MKRAAHDTGAPRRSPAPAAPPPGRPGTLRAVLTFPLRVIGTLLKRAAQILLSIFIVLLHPQFRWLLRLLRRSRLVRDYITPALQQLSKWFYEPYFRWLRGLSPYWAMLSIGLPLAILEPAKAFATILIVERPRIALVLLMFLHGLSFLLIDKTWNTVRPQARKIWLVSRVHAWGWLNYSYGKYWIMNSPSYRAITGWLASVRHAAQTLWAELAKRGAERRARGRANRRLSPTSRRRVLGKRSR